MTDIVELLPCPFCGSEPIFIEGGPDLVGIQCNSARCVNPHISNVSEAFARELWNTRAAYEVMARSELDPDVRRRLLSVAQSLEARRVNHMAVDYGQLAHDIRAALGSSGHAG